jgi:hypothetical protein
MSTHSINHEALASFIGMLDGLEMEFNAGPEDLADIESATHRILLLRDQLLHSQQTGLKDCLDSIRTGNYGKQRKRDLAYKAFWSEVFGLARTCQRLVRELSGSRRVQLQTTDTGLTEAQRDWLARFLHDRF